MTTTTPYTKFGFDTEFFELVQGLGDAQAGAPAGAPKVAAMPATMAQLKVQMEEARQEAYAEGYAVGMSEGQNQAQADLAQLQQHLQNALLALQTAQNEREEHLLAQCLSLLRVTLHHVVGQAMANYGPEMLEYHLRALLPLLKNDEALTLRIHPAARGFHEKLGLPQASIMGLPMHVTSDPNLGPTDAVILWANGGVESKLAQHLDAVDTLLAGAGAHMVNIEHKANLSPLPDVVKAQLHVQAQQVANVAAEPVMPDMDEAEKAARARANALLGDEDELVDALK